MKNKRKSCCWQFQKWKIAKQIMINGGWVLFVNPTTAIRVGIERMFVPCSLFPAPCSLFPVPRSAVPFAIQRATGSISI
ncbi:MAG: hypothetical protein F6J90_08975 [Moorea sp. SIOASIH]|nr:hypothetical protein [Moorena sp. SIOASIH]